MFKPYLWVVIVVNLAAFVLNKHLLRSWVLRHVESGPFVILVNSLPNFVEAVVGTVTLAGMLMSLRDNSESLARWLTDGRLYFGATILAAAFVIPQELNWINLDGNSVYDHYDMAASILGLIAINQILVHFGLVIRRST
jgi:hypothetical protein